MAVSLGDRHDAKVVVRDMGFEDMAGSSDLVKELWDVPLYTVTCYLLFLGCYAMFSRWRGVLFCDLSR
jgi:hypothetical protein